jgi:hypothetical protein
LFNVFRFFRIAAFSMAFLALIAATFYNAPPTDSPRPAPHYAPMSEPDSDTVFTATNEIRALDWDGQTLWAATAGGVLRFQNGAWTKWTRRGGLPANEAFGIERENGVLAVRFPTARAAWDGAQWISHSAPEWKRTPPTAFWNGEKITASLDGLQIGDRKIPLPAAARGTHISAILPREKTLLVAVYGDGLWRWNGSNWARGVAVPEDAREILSLAGNETVLFIGTRRSGVYHWQGDDWEKLRDNKTASEPFAHNIQFLIEFQNVLWASTLDDGLLARTGKGWRHVAPPQISSSAPRQMIEWRGKLYVRHGNGVVDAFDGANWTKNAMPNLPRRGVYALASNDKFLLAAGWGGWAQWDGKSWTKFYDLPGLKGVPILQLALQGDDVWIGTQSRGLAKWTRKTGALKFYDERDGLHDDWITTLLVDGARAWAGTFVGGVYCFENGKWHAFDETENITALSTDGKGGVWAATRRGLFHVKDKRVTKAEVNWLDEEMQALCQSKTGLWIGARTSLNFWKSARVTSPTQ